MQAPSSDTYLCLNKKEFHRGEFSICTIRREDMELIRQWRNSQIEILRQKAPITPEEQQRYFENQLVPGFGVQHPANILFSLFRNEKLIGYGALVHIDWEFRNAEISFLLNPTFIEDPSVYSEIFLNFLELLKEVAFEDLNFHRIYAETYSVRDVHIKVLEEAGLQYEGAMVDHVKVDGKYVNSLLHGLINSKDK